MYLFAKKGPNAIRIKSMRLFQSQKALGDYARELLGDLEKWRWDWYFVWIVRPDQEPELVPSEVWQTWVELRHLGASSEWVSAEEHGKLRQDYLKLNAHAKDLAEKNKRQREEITRLLGEKNA